MNDLLGITQSAFDPASRVRLIQYIPAFHAAGWRVRHRPNRPDRQWASSLRARLPRVLHYRAGRAAMHASRLLDELGAGAYDAVFVNRDLAGSVMAHERLLLRRNPRVVFDFDDAIYLGARNERLVRFMCERAAWVTPGNGHLAEWARQWSDRVTVIPTVIDTDRYTPRVFAEEDRARPMRVGWTGSDNSLRATLLPYLDMIARAQREVPFELVIISNTDPALRTPGLRWRFHPWSAEEEGEIARLFDVGIMPLVDDEFQRGKCGLKLLQCMAAGLPTIASPVGVNAEIVRQGRTGFLARTEAEWQAALCELAHSPDLRAHMGEAGRERCARDYSLRRWFPELLAIVERVAGEREARA